MAQADLPTPRGEGPLADPTAYDPYLVLRHADYRRFLLSGMLATVGGQMQRAAVGWEVDARTHDPAALGLIGLALVAPVLLLALPVGHVLDRYDRKRQILGAVALLGLSSVGLAVLSACRGPVGLTYLFLVASGVGQAFYMPARWALLTQVVPRDQVTSAVAWGSSSWQVAAAVGPALGGLLIARTGGATTAYVLDAVAAALVIVLLAPIRPRPTQRDTQPFSAGSLLAGLRFVFSTPLILATITLDLFAVFLGGATALLPIYAREILKTGPIGFGLLGAAPPLGAFLMALFLAHRPPMRRAGPAMLASVAGFGLATVVFGLSLNPGLSFAMLFLTGALDNISVVVRSTIVQTLTPDAMRGRVSAVNAIFIGSSNELGELESGLAAKVFGTVASVVGGGVGTILVVMAVAAGLPAVRRLRSLSALGPESPTETARPPAVEPVGS